MSNPNALFLLADHIKLSLLERKRAQALNLQSDSQDGHLSRSLDQFRDGLEALQTEQQRLQEAGDDAKAATIADSLPGLQKQFDDLTSQFHGFSAPSTNSTLTQPNDPALAADFAHASNTSTSPPLPSSSSLHPPAKKSLRNGGTSTPTGSSKTVRFQDNNASAAALDEEAAASAQLFNQPYRDDPDGPEGYRDTAEGLADNVQVHAYHSRILREQDDQLDRLGESISRQRELSMQIGDELDGQVALLEDQEALVDRHASRLERARRQVGRIARSAGESKQMIAIIVLIVILVLLIAVLK
ncbi:putative snare domain-containing protein [Diaporthe ampelina]|uniref:Putative snare domain-containing protein n=1 Tax=Diaporthe ampelina TaxID=1214573 RepID=A0A0G2FDD7_9PEZI|nr:putative snare domain-containing protein [Diaporthe ampelina]